MARFIDSRRLLSMLAILGAAIALMPGAARASSLALAPQDVEAIRRAADALQGQTAASVAPLAEGDVKVMQAVVMSASGLAQWRPDARADWKRAAVDDVLDPGAEIRTGRRAKLTLRVGMNATVLVDRLTTVVLPQIVQVGDTLRTAAQVKRGRADFKVDRVGLTNDFSVVTPSTTLAVRGTGFAVQHGSFNGTQVAASRFNELFAIELTYFISRLSYLLSGGSLSNEKHPNPAVAALFQTFGPPPIVSAVIEDADTPALIEAALSGNPIRDGRTVDNAVQSLTDIEMMLPDPPGPPPPPPPPPPPLPPFPPGLGSAEIAEFVCLNLFDIFLTYDGFMQEDFGGADNPGGFTYPGLNQLFFDINEFICQGREEFEDEDLDAILREVTLYCSNQFQTQDDVTQCIANFIDATVDVFNHSPPP